MNLRDHSQPCEHGYEDFHQDSYKGHLTGCPGGRVVEVDYDFISQWFAEELTVNEGRDVLERLSAEVEERGWAALGLEKEVDDD